MLKAALYFCLILVLYNYAIYPALIILYASLRTKHGASSNDTREHETGRLPRVTFLIAAYNEEKVIERKIENTLRIAYPVTLFEILVVSDGSDDNTHEIVSRYAGRGVQSLHQPARRGKTAALNRGVNAATGEIILFSDANNDFSEDAVLNLVRHFRNPAVGGVCGAKRIRPADQRMSTVGDSLYWKYESAIKYAESEIASITNADGEIFAIRKSLYDPIDERIINDDAQITIDLVRKGFRVLYEPCATSYEYASITIKDDFFVKVRMVAGGFQTIRENWRFLLPPRTWFAFTFLSHKVLRWLAPEFLVVVFVTSALLASQHPFLDLFVLQVVFYAVATAGWVFHGRIKLPSFIYLPFYFLVMNVAAAMGLYRYLRRIQTAHWRKAER